MEKLILFPKREYQCFYDGVKCFDEKEYEKAIKLFEKAQNISYFKKKSIKYIIDCHIELHNFDEVYKIIEDEFCDNNVDNEYLLKKYLYTMVIEEQYIEVLELIKIYKDNKNISIELKKYLDKLSKFVEENKNYNSNGFMKYFLSNDFNDHMQIILNLDKLDVNKYILEIKRFCGNPNVDSFIKYCLLKYLMNNNLVSEINYTNYFSESYIINKDNYYDIIESELYKETINNVINNIEHKKVVEPLISNIWLDFCIKYYPHFISDINLGSALLHILVFKSLNTKVNINEICNLYQTNSKQLFNYFKM